MGIPSTTSSSSRRNTILVTIVLIAIIGLGAFLHFYQLGESGVGNQYYAAAIKSMLQSWHNFFFVAFEPGGSVSVDKPPLGFWVQCLFASFLGVTGLALALPNAIAGVLSIFVVYKLVRRPFGAWAGLLAALALALTPVAISTERNNTIDGLLVFVLLLAAWAFLQSVYSRKVGWLFLGAFLVGLGFNIKMLQAFLPLPGFYALYFFAAKYNWKQKLLQLIAATVLLLVVSFSWAVAVDLTPPDNRPFVGGSENNTVMELIFGHNGLSRILGRGMQRIRTDAPRSFPVNTAQPGATYPGDQIPPFLAYPPVQPGGNLPYRPGNTLPIPGGNAPPVQTPGGVGSRQAGSDGVMDVGTPGVNRLFTFPLVGEIGWLLPFVLGGLLLIGIVLGLSLPINKQQAALIMWAGWLIPEMLYFTFSTGIMHAYYMIMMGAPLAALFAMTGWACKQMVQKRKWLSMVLLCLLAGGTIVFQAFTLQGRTSCAACTIVSAGILLLLGAFLVVFFSSKMWMVQAGISIILLAVLASPGLWSFLTTFNATPNSGLPYSGPAQVDNSLAKNEAVVQQLLLKFLLENTDNNDYLLATVTANQAAPFILATGRAVFTFGGFGGMDQIVDVMGLSSMVEAGRLRFILNEGLDQRKEILGWLVRNCSPLNIPGLPARALPGLSRRNDFLLFDCGK